MSADLTPQPSSIGKNFIQIDEDGYFKMDDVRLADQEVGQALIAGMRMDDRGRAIVNFDGKKAIVEAFDEPLVVRQIEPGTHPRNWVAQFPYGYREEFSLESLTLDEWDRFHGRTQNGVPFVFSRPAQATFFQSLTDYDDESITMGDQKIQISPWLSDQSVIDQSPFWTNIYRTEQPGWELGEPARAIAALVPRLKLMKSRIIVLGCGSGHDAAWFADQGHFVTGVDFSEEAIARAKAQYGHIETLSFLQADAFQLPEKFNGQFDLVVEHTCFCAINPSRRSELVKVWRRLLADNGHLLGVFFTFDKVKGPPFGASEWELRSRLQKYFRHLIWTRWRDSIEKRMGMELVIYMQKKPGESSPLGNPRRA